MFGIIGKPSRTAEPLAEITIEALLSELEQYTFVDIFNSERTGEWSARATMRISMPGAKFEVHSGFHHKTAKEALMALIVRVRQAYKEANPSKQLT